MSQSTDNNGQRKGICQLPNGLAILFPSLFSTLALAFSSHSLGSCDWYRSDVTVCELNQCQKLRIGHGIFAGDAYEWTGSISGFVRECTTYSQFYWEEEADYYHWMAVVMSCLAVFLGFIMFVVSWAGFGVKYKKCGWTMISICFFILVIAQSISLIFFGNEGCRMGDACDVGPGSISCMIAAALWVPCAMGSCSLPSVKETPNKATKTKKKRSLEEGEVGEGTKILLTETVYADETKRIERKTTRPGGTQIVELLDENGNVVNEQLPYEPTMDVIAEETDKDDGNSREVNAERDIRNDEESQLVADLRVNNGEPGNVTTDGKSNREADGETGTEPSGAYESTKSQEPIRNSSIANTDTMPNSANSTTPSDKAKKIKGQSETSNKPEDIESMEKMESIGSLPAEAKENELHSIDSSTAPRGVETIKKLSVSSNENEYMESIEKG